MGPDLVEVADRNVEYLLKLLLMQDEQVIKTRSTHTPEKASTDDIRSWCVIEKFAEVVKMCLDEAYGNISAVSRKLRA